eukprot:1236451-Pyramimonas_sp.AAC.1
MISSHVALRASLRCRRLAARAQMSQGPRVVEERAPAATMSRLGALEGRGGVPEVARARRAASEPRSPSAQVSGSSSEMGILRVG